MKKQRLQTEIPQEILEEEILSRLPVKSLVRFKCVCKSWNNLISGSPFLKLHLQKSIDQNRNKLVYLRGFSTTLEYEARPASPLMVEQDESADVDISLLAYCNGLFCISIGNDAYLWNPSTKESRKVADSAVEFPAYSSRAHAFFGLGYRSESDDYRLVRISTFDNVDPLLTEVRTYSRNSGTWRRIGDFPYDLLDACPGVFADGSLHWIVGTWVNGGDWKRGVAMLDLKDDSYGLVQLPELGSEEIVFNIGLLGEKLVVFYNSADCSSNIWIREERGRVESWTRIKIAMDSVGGTQGAWYFQPLYYLEPGKILVRLDFKTVATFDLEKKQCYAARLSYMWQFHMISYVESLASPYSPTLY